MTSSKLASHALVPIFFALLAVGVPVLAQSPGGGVTLNGSLVDAQNGIPVAGAQVRLPNLHRVEVSHEDGTFELQRIPPGTHELIVQRIGYRRITRSVTVAGDTAVTLRIELDPVAVTLTPQIVTGTISERSGEEVLSPTSVVSGRALDRNLSSTIATTLRDQPGVSVTSIGPATGRPVIRGLGGDRILVLEDGQRPGDLSSTSGDHAVAIDPLTASRIEVVRGPMSLLYGSSALGGVVNVVRDEVPTILPEHTGGTFTLQGSTVDDGVSGGGFATSRLGKVAVRVEGSARTNGDMNTPQGELPNTQGRTFSASTGAAYIGDTGYAGLAYRWYNNNYGIPGGFIGAHPGGVNVEMRRHTVRGDAERHFGGAIETIRLSGLHTAYQHKEIEASGSVGTFFDQDLTAADLVARHGAIGPFALGAIGTRLQYRDIMTGGSLRSPSTFDWSAAGFIVEELGTGKLRTQVGARYDWARYSPRELTTIFVGGELVPVRRRTFGSVSGSLGVLYAATEGVRFGASIARAYRTPDFNELYSDGPHLAANSYDVGDPNLRAEAGIGVDAFMRVHRDRFQGEIAAFRNQLNDYIFPSSRGRAELGRQGEPRFQYTNENVLLSGAEGRIEVGLTPSLIFDATTSYVRGRFTSDRAPIPVISNAGADTTFIPASMLPPLIPPLRARTALRFDQPRYFVEAGARLSARQERTGDFEEPTAGYGVVDASVGLRLLSGTTSHSITLRLDNALDKEYRDHLSRTKAVMPEPGRSVGLLYRLSF